LFAVSLKSDDLFVGRRVGGLDRHEDFGVLRVEGVESIAGSVRREVVAVREHAALFVSALPACLAMIAGRFPGHREVKGQSGTSVAEKLRLTLGRVVVSVAMTRR
jgi:hypothetical protein